MGFYKLFGKPIRSHLIEETNSSIGIHHFVQNIFYLPVGHFCLTTFLWMKCCSNFMLDSILSQCRSKHPVAKMCSFITDYGFKSAKP